MCGEWLLKGIHWVNNNHLEYEFLWNYHSYSHQDHSCRTGKRTRAKLPGEQYFPVSYFILPYYITKLWVSERASCHAVNFANLALLPVPIYSLTYYCQELTLLVKIFFTLTEPSLKLLSFKSGLALRCILTLHCEMLQFFLLIIYTINRNMPALH